MKNVYLLVFDGLADWEIGLITYELNTRNTIPVTTVGFTLEPIRTGGGLRVLPDISLAEIDHDSTALLLLPGGDHQVFGRRKSVGDKGLEPECVHTELFGGADHLRQLAIVEAGDNMVRHNPG